MKIGVIGDDFTGSSDAANTLARAGARTLQYAGVPEAPAGPGIDAAVISLKTRSVPVADAVAQSLAACRWLTANGAEQVAFKYCSTFDSTREGNIGPVAEALLGELAAELALVCPAFPATGRTLYQGHLFVHDRLLSEFGDGEAPADADDRPRPQALARVPDAAEGRAPAARCGARRRGRRAGANRRAPRRGGRRRRRGPDASRAGGAGASAGDRRIGDPARPAGELRHRAGRGGGVRRARGTGPGGGRQLLGGDAQAGGGLCRGASDAAARGGGRAGARGGAGAGGRLHGGEPRRRRRW